MTAALPPEPIIRAMVKVRRRAMRRNCRVKEWNLTEDQAWQLARETSMNLGDNVDLFFAMKRGTIRMLGAQVKVI